MKCRCRCMSMCSCIYNLNCLGIICRSSQWKCFNLSGWKEEAWKNSGLNGNWTHDLCDTGTSSNKLYEIHIFELRIKMELYVDHLVPSVLIRSSNIWISYINVHLIFSIYGINTNSQLTSSQLAWQLSWLERCTGIAEVMGSIPVQAWIFQVSSFQPLRLKHFHCDDLHIIPSLSAVQIYVLIFHILMFINLSS